jgi:hypothetical protein
MKSGRLRLTPYHVVIFSQLIKNFLDLIWVSDEPQAVYAGRCHGGSLSLDDRHFNEIRVAWCPGFASVFWTLTRAEGGRVAQVSRLSRPG